VSTPASVFDDGDRDTPVLGPYRSQSAHDAQRMGYGGPSYHAYLDEAAQRIHDYFAARGDTATAQEMFIQSLGEALRGNDGD
jgi:hypothetical protein